MENLFLARWQSLTLLVHNLHTHALRLCDSTLSLTFCSVCRERYVFCRKVFIDKRPKTLIIHQERDKERDREMGLKGRRGDRCWPRLILAVRLAVIRNRHVYCPSSIQWNIGRHVHQSCCSVALPQEDASIIHPRIGKHLHFFTI